MPGHASRHAAVRPLRFEGLEPRRVLATFIVTNLLDDGPGSLRDAIDQANAADGADEIDFAVTGVIPLESQLPTITDSVSINGPGRDLLTLDARNGADGEFATGDGYRIFYVDDGDSDSQSNVAFSGLALTGGDVGGDAGGAILNFEDVRLSNSRLAGNATYVGGAVFSLGSLQVANTLVSDNWAFYDGGGIANYAIAHIVDSVISNNVAFHWTARGGGIFNRDGQLFVTRSVVQANTATESGGGLYSEDGDSHIVESDIVDNRVLFWDNIRAGNGGGVAHWGGELSILASRIAGNSADRSGGGIAASGRVTIHNSTFALNEADDQGGAIALSDGVADVTNTTIIDNTATEGGGISRLWPSLRGGRITVTLMNSVVSENTASIGPDLNIDRPGDVVTGSFNLIGGDPMLGPLADNGGPTLTHAPLPGSPLVDTGDPAFDVNGPDGLPGTDDDVPFDQRGEGFARVAGGRVDIGAFEVQVAAPLPGDANDDGVVDLLDLDILGFEAGNSFITPLRSDFNGDGRVDLLDLDILGQNWGATAPAFARAEAPLPGDANDDGVVDLLDLDILGWSTSFDLNADFNGDGRVNLLDLDIPAQNWGRRALLLGDDEPVESDDTPTIAARDEALADEPAAEQSPSLSGRG